MISPDDVRAAKAAHPDWTLQMIAKHFNSSRGVVRRRLTGEALPRTILKSQPRQFRRLPYAGRP